MNAEKHMEVVNTSKSWEITSFAQIICVALIYSITARLSLFFVLKPEGIAAIWPPSGIFLAALLLTHRSRWFHLVGLLFVVDWIAEMLAGTATLISLTYAAVLCCEALLGAWLLLRCLGGPVTITRVRDVVGLVILSAVLSNAITSLAAAAAPTLALGLPFWSSWKAWWTSDAAGIMLVAPFVLSWLSGEKIHLKMLEPKRMLEAIVLFGPMTAFSYLAFHGLPAGKGFSFLWGYVTLPFLIWAALRFGTRGVTTASLILAVVGLRCTLAGYDPLLFTLQSRVEAVLGIQIYLAVISVSTLVLAAAVSERKETEEALLKNQALLNETQRITKVGGWEYDLAAGRITWTDEVYRIYGISKDAYDPNNIAQNIQFYAPEDQKCINEAFWAAVEKGKPYDLELKFISADGQKLWVQTLGRAEKKAGKVVRVFGNIRDITERKQAEEKIRESERRYHQLFENMSSGVAVYEAVRGGEDFIFKDFNKAGEKIEQVSREHLLRKSVTEVFPGVKEFRLLEVFQRVWRNGISEHFPVAFYKDQRIAGWRENYVYKLPSGEVVAVYNDVTERKQAEEELRITNEELLAINRIINTTASTTGVQGILESILDEALSVTGLEGGTICMVTPDDTLHLAAHRATFEATIQDLTTNIVKIGDCLCGQCARDRKPLILPDREAVLKFATREATRGEDIRFHAAFPLLAAEKCLGVLCVFTRTDKKPAQRSLRLLETVSSQIALAVENAQLYEETLRHAEILEGKVRERTEALEENQQTLMNIVKDLNEKSEALKAANVKLQELDRLKSMFIASMSHELRTPLNSIIGFTGIMLQGMAGKINDEQRDQLQRVYRSGKHLLALINDVIDISKIEAGKIDIHVEEFGLDDVISEAVSILRSEIEQKGLDFYANFTSGVRLRTDRKRLFQCILNYLNNAVKFTPKGRISVDVREIDSMIEIWVKDTGIGIKEEDLPKLFESFVRLDSPLRMASLGTGLGLYLTRKLATEVLQGAVSVKSTFEKGSTFTLKIPREINA